MSRLVRTCPRLESGLRLGQEGIHACQTGPFQSPALFTAEEAATLTITKEMLIDRRLRIFEMLNDENCDTPCKHCVMSTEKPLEEVIFDRIGHIDLAATTICNLRCNYCGYTHLDNFSPEKFNALSVLKLFSPEDVEWNSFVDFNGGEPTLLKNFDEYLLFFKSMRIRVFLFTNGLIYKPAIYEGLLNGSISWVSISLDAGTPSTYNANKRTTRYTDVIANLVRYSHAGGRGGGNVSAKYIFCQDNCSDDDVVGFVYTMLAVRPQRIWLTFDFNPLVSLPGDSDSFGGYDYTSQISAYARVYVMLEAHGIQAGHYAEHHLAKYTKLGKLLHEAVVSKINQLREKLDFSPDLILNDSRSPVDEACVDELSRFSIDPLILKVGVEDWRPWSLEGKRVAVAPAYGLTPEALSSAAFRGANVIAYLDRDPVLQGKTIGHIPVHGYSSLEALNLDYILIAAADRHHKDIASRIVVETGDPGRIVVFNPR